jgi:cellulose synthase/poly-beta-1,6-N-acetylglucosamine synthase-like glycosyltransferase
MIKVLDVLLSVAAILLLIPVVVIFVQVIFAYLPMPRKKISREEISREERLTPGKTRIAVLIPAHNEAEGIAATIISIVPQLKPGDRLIVVADNCSDDTARIAIEAGAEAIERHDLSQRGKGYALDFGIRFITQDPPEVVVIIDADCSIQGHTLNKLVEYSLRNDRPVQSLYLMLAPQDAGLKIKIAEFAWVVKNWVRPLGFAKLGLPCQLMGTGMAFPWEIISGADLANGNIVEDMKLGIDLCKSGRPPLFYADTVVTSYFPTTAGAQSGQRTRWEHGHLGMILAEAPQLFKLAFSRGNKSLLGMALDLCVPPLALLVAMLSGLLILTGFAYLAGLSSVPLLIATSGAVIFVAAILLAWLGWGRHIISLLTFLFIPVYVVSKIPYYVGFLWKRQKNWVRTDRK